jgi:hypothetical protein
MKHEHLHARIRLTRSRAAVLKWEARQSTLAHGIWYRLRRLLTFSCELWAVDDAKMNELIASGFTVAPEGEGIEPSKRIVLLPSTHRERLAGGRPLPLGLRREVLAEPNLVLVLWEGNDVVTAVHDGQGAA